MNEAKNIYQRINQVMKKVEYIKKDLKIQGYSAVSHDNVTALVRKHMVDEGIILTVSQESERFDEREQNSKMRLYHACYTIIFTGINDENSHVSVKVCSQAYDNGDKAPGKAMSYATKYALLKTFMIETGENEESRAFDPNNELISSTELLELQELLKESGKTSEYLIEYLNKKGANIISLDQLIESTFQYSKALLLNAIKKSNED